MGDAAVMHLGLKREHLEGATLAIVPGDPFRVPKIAALCDSAKPLAHVREYCSHLGRLDGHPVVVCSTGIGGPATSICLEELAQLGIRTVIRAGTTGAIQPHVRKGDLVVSQASVRLDGASFHFAPPEFPAVADFWLTHALTEAARAAGVPWHVGITASSDTFYPGQERYDTHTGRVARRFQGSMQEWRDLGVLNYEMETASLFTIASALGLKAGAVLGVIANRTDSEEIDHALADATVAATIGVALAAARAWLANAR